MNHELLFFNCFQTVTHITRHSNIVIKKLISPLFSLTNTQLHVSKTVGSFLFDGYDDRLLDLLEKLPPQPNFPPIPFKRYEKLNTLP